MVWWTRFMVEKANVLPLFDNRNIYYDIFMRCVYEGFNVYNLFKCV